MEIETTKAPVRRKRNGAERRQQIIRHAVELFLRKGYAGTSIRDVAEACGINLATMYYHVGSKQNLLALFREDTEEAFINEVQSHIVKIRNIRPSEAIRRVVQLYISYIMKNPGVTRYWYAQFRFLPKEEQRRIVEMDERFIAILSEIIGKGVASGEFKQLDSYLASNTVIFLCEMFTMRSTYLTGRISTDEYAKFVGEFVLSGLRLP